MLPKGLSQLFLFDDCIINTLKRELVDTNAYKLQPSLS